MAILSPRASRWMHWRRCWKQGNQCPARARSPTQTHEPHRGTQVDIAIVAKSELPTTLPADSANTLGQSIVDALLEVFDVLVPQD
jgi:D-alanyl-D-alanine dipeptidase